MYAILVIISILAISADGAKVDWTYTPGPTGPKNWTKVSADCGKARQSPIDIITSKVVMKELPKLDFSSNYKTTPSNTGFFMSNNGHTFSVLLKLPQNHQFYLKISPQQFVPYQFHFHWGSVDARGSEHLINNKAYPAELHFIHRNIKYENVSVALTKPDGLAVIGIFLTLQSADNPFIGKLTSHFNDIRNSPANKTIPSFPFADAFPAGDMSEFYFYEGSLTTPKCQEAVHWYVMKQTIGISRTQLHAFRSLRHGSGNSSYAIVDNHRPVLPINSRIVYESAGHSIKAGLVSTLGFTAMVTLIALQMSK